MDFKLELYQKRKERNSIRRSKYEDYLACKIKFEDSKMRSAKREVNSNLSLNKIYSSKILQRFLTTKNHVHVTIYII